MKVGNQKPSLLVVGGVSKSFRAAYEAAVKLEEAGGLEIIYKGVGEPLECTEKLDHKILPTCLTGEEEFYKYLPTYEKLSKKHTKPFWHKGRW